MKLSRTLTVSNAEIQELIREHLAARLGFRPETTTVLIQDDELSIMDSGEVTTASLMAPEPHTQLPAAPLSETTPESHKPTSRKQKAKKKTRKVISDATKPAVVADHLAKMPAKEIMNKYEISTASMIYRWAQNKKFQPTTNKQPTAPPKPPEPLAGPEFKYELGQRVEYITPQGEFHVGTILGRTWSAGHGSYSVELDGKPGPINRVTILEEDITLHEDGWG